MRSQRRESGIILLIVLFFVLLLTSAVATFARQASVDGLVARHRDAAREAEAIARGGVELAKALLLQDRMAEVSTELRVESVDEPWAQVAEVPIPVGEFATLRLQILDAGARFNVNALFSEGEARAPQTLPFLEDLLERVVEEMPGRPEDKFYEPRELARNLVDFIDANEEALESGAPEDDPYQRAALPYRAPNRPLRSLDELRMVDGFDGPLVASLRPYLTVYPWVGGDGINPNTAPPHVLGLLYHGVSEEYRLADADEVGDVLTGREEGNLWCDESASHPRCRPLTSVLPGTLYPPASWSSEVFTVISQATVGDVTRTVEAVLDRSEANNPTLLAWRTR